MEKTKIRSLLHAKHKNKKQNSKIFRRGRKGGRRRERRKRENGVRVERRERESIFTTLRLHTLKLKSSVQNNLYEQK